MKKLRIIALAATVLAIACTKENEYMLSETEAAFFSNGEGWTKISLNLPSAPATKANDDFNDGEANEYAVESARLVIFAGLTTENDEDKCTIRSAYELSTGDWNKEDNGQITTSRAITQRVISSNIQPGESVYALVLLNDYFFKVQSIPGSDISQLMFKDESLNGKTFAEFKKILLEESDDKKDYSNMAFVMTNMPHIHSVGKTSAPEVERPWTLVRFDSSKIYPTEAQARGGEAAAEICVERIVAKVTVNVDSNVSKLINDETVTFSTLGWFIDNINTKTYVVRNVEDPSNTNPYAYIAYRSARGNSPSYRMVSATAIHNHANAGTGATAPDNRPVVRTYWGMDHNYNSEASDLVSDAGRVVDNRLMDFDASHINRGGHLRPAGSSYYCLENTFDVKNMQTKNTTRIVMAAEFNNGNDFYTLTTEPNTIMGEADAIAKVKSMILKRVNILTWLSTYFESTATDEQKLALVSVTVVPIKEGNNSTGKAQATISIGNDNDLQAVLKPGQKLEDAKTAYGTIAADQTEYINSNINSQLNFFSKGVSYYQALIRHFDNDETYWKAEETMTNTTESIYNNNNENDYLGRYGVLRNNWYEVNVSGIRQIGYPVVPELTDDPDDVVEQYIQVKINIMPWAKRTQDVIL